LILIIYIKKGDKMNLKRLVNPDTQDILEDLDKDEVEYDDDEYEKDFEEWLIKTGQKKVLAGE